MDIQLLVFLIATRYVRYALEIIFHDDNRPILKGEWKYWGARWFGWIEFHSHKWKDFKLLINKIKGYDVFFFFFEKWKFLKGGNVLERIPRQSMNLSRDCGRSKNLSIFELVWIFEWKNEFLKGKGRMEMFNALLWIINANSLDRQTRIYREKIVID